ncbi:HNH endonuclease [Brevibacterium sp. R8603A2]|uniref:HNH endonuclease n=1 Tax=Brevibacterium sp. R8603A2 TaxID=2929779 RepID=UPI001FFA62EA|nr:HNH endonuclease signature motif containing protein [Brevibacterium sp. R8603A2]MCK1801479.1 HNH endonuclease [Brevibacterium sp. R8603A2]
MSTPRQRSTAYRRNRLTYLKANPNCYYCGDIADTVDHIIALSHGGDELDPKNWRPACRTCNSARGNRTPPTRTSRQW